MHSLVLEWDHVRFSDTRFLIGLYMGATMAAIMFAVMLGMYRDARKNMMIFGVARVFFGQDFTRVEPSGSALTLPS